MSDYRYPAPPPPPASSRVGVFARLWTLFRGTPVWVQVGLWILAWPLLAALLLVSTPPRPGWPRSLAAIMVLLLATPVWAAPFTSDDGSVDAEPIRISGSEPAAAVPVEEPAAEPEPESQPDVRQVLAAQIETICQDALQADDRSAGRIALRDAARRLAPDTDFSVTEITRAATQACGSDIVALGPQAAPEPEFEPEPEPEPAPEPAPEPEPTPPGDVWTVTNVVDGDTVDVAKGSTTERVRVIGIDTPERGECGFGPASSALSALILNEQVVLTPGARDDRDRYDRILRYIDVGDSDAGLSLIEQGLAIARYDSRDGYGRHPRQDVYVAADSATPHQCDGVTAPAPEPAPPPPSGGPGSGPGGAWKNCTEARDAGAAPVYRDDPGYGSHLDRDDDGIGCE